MAAAATTATSAEATTTKSYRQTPQCVSAFASLLRVFFLHSLPIPQRDACEYSLIITFMTFMDEHFCTNRHFLSLSHTHALTFQFLPAKCCLAQLCGLLFHRSQTRASFISLYRLDEAIIPSYLPLHLHTSKHHIAWNASVEHYSYATVISMALSSIFYQLCIDIHISNALHHRLLHTIQVIHALCMCSTQNIYIRLSCMIFQ